MESGLVCHYSSQWTFAGHSSLLVSIVATGQDSGFSLNQPASLSRKKPVMDESSSQAI